MENCEKYSHLFTQLALNQKNSVIYHRDKNLISINEKTELTENIEPRFGKCDFSNCLKSYYETNKYTGQLNTRHIDDDGQICFTIITYKNGKDCSIGYNCRTKQTTFF
jgi:hypothetical protein